MPRPTTFIRSAFLALAALLLGATPAAAAAATPGVAVGGHDPNLDWPALYQQGARFAYVQATTGTTQVNPSFQQQYDGAAGAGLFPGAAHFALPDRSSGAAQAAFFVDHGGGWTPGGKTLPGTLDIEYNPYGPTCYGMSQSAMRTWLKDFVATYQARVGRPPVVYTTRDWWVTCTGDYTGLSSLPLWIGGDVTNLPGGWTTWTFRPVASQGTLDRHHFNGDEARLAAFARG